MVFFFEMLQKNAVTEKCFLGKYISLVNIQGPALKRAIIKLINSNTAFT